MKKLIISTILILLVLTGSVFADEMTFEEKARQCAEDYLDSGSVQTLLRDRNIYNENDVLAIDKNSYLTIPVNIPLEDIETNQSNPKSYIFIVNVNDKAEVILEIEKTHDGSPVVSYAGGEASKFLMYKQQFEEVADGDYAVLQGFNEHYFYGKVGGKTVVMPAFKAYFNEDKAQAYMLSTKQNRLLIEKNDFVNMLKKQLEMAEKGLMGGNVLNYLPEKVGMQNTTSTAWYIVTGVVFVLCILSSIVIIKKKNSKSILKNNSK